MDFVVAAALARAAASVIDKIVRLEPNIERKKEIYRKKTKPKQNQNKGRRKREEKRRSATSVALIIQVLHAAEGSTCSALGVPSPVVVRLHALGEVQEGPARPAAAAHTHACEDRRYSAAL